MLVHWQALAPGFLTSAYIFQFEIIH